MRVTAAYHSALRRQWNSKMPNPQWHPFSVSEAEIWFHSFAIPWRRVIAAIRDRSHRRTLRKLADAMPVTTSACITDLREIPWREFGSDKPEYRRRALSLGFLIQRWLELLSDSELAVGVLYEGSAGVMVKVSCDSLGAAALWRKSGMTVEHLKHWCWEMRVDFYDIFPWVPLNYTGRVNPLHRPVETPDINNEIAELLE